MFDWISGDLDPNNHSRRTISLPESGETQQLFVGYSKGMPTFSRYAILLSGTVTEGTASMFSLLYSSAEAHQ